MRCYVDAGAHHIAVEQVPPVGARVIITTPTPWPSEDPPVSVAGRVVEQIWEVVEGRETTVTAIVELDR